MTSLVIALVSQGRNPDATVTNIFVPVKSNFERVISCSGAYDSVDTNCSPSHGLQYQATGWSVSWNKKINLAFLLPYLQSGVILNILNYEGSNAAFTVGPQTVYQTLDPIKAALSSIQTTNIGADANVTMFGYSGGGFATEWATEIRAWYAPKLPIVGAVIGGPSPNVTSTYYNVNKVPLSILNGAAILRIMSEWM
ncbi:hypothetical protein N7539_001663 [Penicillium diatomitis]|uniref:Uncharacterized protein n=1 Tax=Penicillium diatomitis TaxID=2819901 RepID=A0A9W9XH74_9EURO|nr:uncharacterized protein N7539_001663 [Penicillium diatomitis]KAJ5492917.1 hypothetical protein N7539_001663 [Penicillium diatomitis]